MKLNYYKETASLYIDLAEKPSTESKEISEGIVYVGSGLQPEPLVNVLRSFVNPLVQSARLNQPQDLRG